MATAKTECSELSLGFGLLGYGNPSEINYVDIASKFGGSLAEAKFNSFVRTYPSNRIYVSMNSSTFAVH